MAAPRVTGRRGVSCAAVYGLFHSNKRARVINSVVQCHISSRQARASATATLVELMNGDLETGPQSPLWHVVKILTFRMENLTE